MADQCISLWGKAALPVTSFAKLVETSSGRKLWTVYNKKKNSKKNTIVLLHGLGDTHMSLQRLQKKLVNNGHDVLLVDLHGHGKSLEARWKSVDKVPEKIDFKDSVEDVIDIIQRLNLQDFVLVGHSYGAAIAHQVASVVKPRKLVMMAPYVARIDRFILENIDQQWVETQSLSLQSLGIPESVARAVVFPQQQMADLNSITKKWLLNFFLNEASTFYQTPYMDYILSAIYKKSMATNESNMPKDVLDLRVAAALAATKGILDLDLISSTQVTKSPTLLIGASKDAVVPILQLQEFAKKLSKENVNFDFITFEGRDHRFPMQAAEVELLMPLILD